MHCGSSGCVGQVPISGKTGGVRIPATQINYASQNAKPGSSSPTSLLAPPRGTCRARSIAPQRPKRAHTRRCRDDDVDVDVDVHVDAHVKAKYKPHKNKK